MKNWNAQDGENQNICENFLTSLLLLLFVKDVSYETEDSPFIITEHYNKTTRKIIRYVEQNYFSAFSLEEMGKELNYNKNYLCALFSKSVGISIIDYVNFLRMRKAIGSFLYFSYDVATTAEGLGFSSTDYFGRIFKRFVGVTPRDFYRAVSSFDAEERSRFNDEQLLSYRPYTIEDGLASMRRIGTHVLALKEEKSGQK
jgi:AraC-like DNA-binding protein